MLHLPPLKKRLTCRLSLTTPLPVAGRMGPEGQHQYEGLRQEALEPAGVGAAILRN